MLLGTADCGKNQIGEMSRFPVDSSLIKDDIPSDMPNLCCRECPGFLERRRNN